MQHERRYFCFTTETQDRRIMWTGWEIKSWKAWKQPIKWRKTHSLENQKSVYQTEEKAIRNRPSYTSNRMDTRNKRILQVKEESDVIVSSFPS